MIVEKEVLDTKKILKYMFNIKMIQNLNDGEALMKKKSHLNPISIKLPSGKEISQKSLNLANLKNYGSAGFKLLTTKVTRSTRKIYKI